MLQLLYKYLILNKNVTLPGLGVFYIQRHPSSLDYPNKQFIAPSADIAFAESDDEGDKKLCWFIVNNQHIDEQSAIQNLNRFASEIKEKLRSTGTVQLPGIGILTTDRAGCIHFKQVQRPASFYRNVASERMMRAVSTEDSQISVIKEDNHVIKEVEVEEAEFDTGSSLGKRDYWWVYSIIVASIAVAAITYYYYQNGSLR